MHLRTLLEVLYSPNLHVALLENSGFKVSKNILGSGPYGYKERKPWVIDVSQSVEGDHPRSLDFLRMDIKNVSDFFRRQGVSVLRDMTAFGYITKADGDLGFDAVRAEIDHTMASRTDADDKEDEVDFTGKSFQEAQQMIIAELIRHTDDECATPQAINLS